MSRKRSSSRGITITDSYNECTEMEEYEYFTPGCYCTPQIVQHHHPNGCPYLREYLPQWNIVNPATYIVDEFGTAFYLSDFEYQLHLPRGMAVATEISYHYTIEDDDGDEGYGHVALTPRKKERFDLECDEEVEVKPPMYDGNAKKGKSYVPPAANGTDEMGELKGNAYRAEEGYIVEEPIEADDDAPTKGTVNSQ